MSIEAMKLALEQRITDYLSGGGLFNPELADHIAVRDLLIDCREALAEQPAQQQKQNYSICPTCGGMASDPIVPPSTWQQEPVTILPDGSAFAVVSYPLPKEHWLYAERQYEEGAEEPIELGKPILTHALRDAVVAAVRYAIRGATNCGKESDFDPDALVQNAVYALCGPFTSPQPAQQQEPVRLRRGDVLRCIETGELCTAWATSTTGKTLIKWGSGDFGAYTAEQIGDLFWLEPQPEELELAAEQSDNYAAFHAGYRFAVAHSPASKPLTDEEIWNLAANCLDSVAGRLQFARAIEAKLREKNGGVA